MSCITDQLQKDNEFHQFNTKTIEDIFFLTPEKYISTVLQLQYGKESVILFFATEEKFLNMCQENLDNLNFEKLIQEDKLNPRVISIFKAVATSELSKTRQLYLTAIAPALETFFRKYQSFVLPIDSVATFIFSFAEKTYKEQLEHAKQINEQRINKAIKHINLYVETRQKKSHN